MKTLEQLKSEGVEVTRTSDGETVLRCQDCGMFWLLENHEPAAVCDLCAHPENYETIEEATTRKGIEKCS